jgi:DNA-directed RNA polymerase subunit H (RpoH/RPB5)
MSQYININLKSKEVNSNIILNTIKMILRRDNDYSENKVNSIYSSLKDKVFDSIIDLKINNNKYSIYIINSKLNSITVNSPIDEYLNKNLDIKKFLVINDPSKRAVKQIFKYKNAEFFFVHNLIKDITEPYFVPEHIKLNEEQIKLLKDKIKIKDLSTIYDLDVMSRYYGAKEGDVFKIIRPNITCGDSIYYRAVHKGKIDILFHK